MLPLPSQLRKMPFLGLLHSALLGPSRNLYAWTKYPAAPTRTVRTLAMVSTDMPLDSSCSAHRFDEGESCFSSNKTA